MTAATLEVPPTPTEEALPGTYPLPPGRGLWRLTLHTRSFAAGTSWQSTMISELVRARSRQVVQEWNKPASLTFTLDGHAPEASYVAELRHDVIAWRWDDTSGVDRAVGRFCVTQSEDELTEQKHVTVYTAHDYLSVMSRRFAPVTLNFAQIDQDNIVTTLLAYASTSAQSSAGASLMPGSYMPVTVVRVNPDGTARAAASGQLRDRTYGAQTNIGDTALADLAAVIGGFDFDLLPLGAPGANEDALRVFYPSQGITRTSPVLVYGGSVATVTRTVNSDTYANLVRVLGNNASADPAAPQLFSETRNADATGTLVGLWPFSDNAADVSIQSTLDQKAAGDLANMGVLLPSYSLGLRPGFYYPGLFNMGDTLPLVIQSGRLNVQGTPVRVLGITYNVGDDGQEDVALVLGRPVQSLYDIFTKADRDVDALVRR